MTPTDLRRLAIVRTPLTIAPNATVQDAIILLGCAEAADVSEVDWSAVHSETRSSCVVVVDDNHQVIGLLSERDIIRLQAQHREGTHQIIREHMSEVPIILQESEISDIDVLGHLFQEFYVRHLPILDQHNQLVGLVTTESLMFARNYRGTQTEAKESQRELPASKQCDSTLAKLTPVAILHFDALLNCLRVTPIWEEMTGSPLESALGQGWIDAFHPEDRDYLLGKCNEYYARLPEDNSAMEMWWEGRHLRPDGSINWFCVQVVPELDEQGQIVGYIGTLTDITDSKRAAIFLEQANQQLEARVLERTADLTEYQHLLEQLLNTQADVVYVYDLIENRNIFINDQIVWILGYTPEEIQDMGSHLFATLMHPEDLPRIAKRVKRFLKFEPESMMDVECRMRHVNGEWRWLQSRVRIFKNTSEGTPWQIIGTGIDISDRKQAEEDLKASKRRLQFALDGSGDGLWDWNIATGEVYLSPQWLGMLGYRPGELPYHVSTWQKVIHPDDLPWVMDRLDAHLKDTHYPYVFDYRVLTKSGDWKWIANYGKVVIRDDQGNPLRMAGLHKDISERKQVEATLQESERKLRAIFDSTFSFMGLLTTEGRVVEANRAALNLIEVELSEVVGQLFWETPWWQHFPEQHPRLQRAIADAAQGKSVRFESQPIWAKGQPAFVDLSIKPVLDEEGTVILLVPEGRDITELKLAEQTLQLSQAKFEALVTNMPGMVYRYLPTTPDCPHHFTFVSQHSYELLELAPETIIQDIRTFTDLIHPEDLSSFLSSVSYAVEHFLPWSWEGRIITPSGKLKWIQGNSQAQKTQESEVWDGLLLDLSDRKQAEIALKVSEERWQFALDGARDGVWDWNAQTNEVFYSHQWKAMLGYSDAEIGNTLEEWDSRLHPDDREECYADLNRHLQGETEFYQNEHRVRCKNDSYKWVLDRGKVLERAEDGQPLRVIGTHTDITVRKQAQEQLAILNQTLEQKVQERTAQLQEREQALIQATRLKDEFLATMSHELRTPLNCILGNSEMLLEQILGTLTPNQIELVQMIDQSGQHLLDLINTLLDVSKIEAGQMEFHPEMVSLLPIYQDSLNVVQPQALKKQIMLKSHIPARCPTFWADEKRIRQVLINLLSNAVKFTPSQGQITLEASCISQPPHDREESPADYIRISVTDTGIGIAAEDIPKLFQPFVQIDSSLTRKYDGTGLGLALVKRMVELHGGSIDVTSEVGVGSCFTLTLPCLASTSDLNRQRLNDQI